jgi:hypothetical protein
MVGTLKTLQRKGQTGLCDALEVFETESSLCFTHHADRGDQSPEGGFTVISPLSHATHLFFL